LSGDMAGVWALLLVMADGCCRKVIVLYMK
jgi:hypothetical protein